MKFIIALSFFISSLAFAQTPPNRIMCSFENGYFKVFDGPQRYEKYVGGREATVDCASDFGAMVSNGRFVTYFRGNFQEEYISGNGLHRFLVRGHLAVAIMGYYLVVSKAGGGIVEKYLSGTINPVMQVSSSLAMIANNSYLYATDGNQIVERYIGSLKSPLLVSGRGMGAALNGDYLYVYHNGKISDDYIGGSSGNDSLAGGRTAQLIAASVGKKFVVYDGRRGNFQEYYTGKSGKVEVRDEGAYHIAIDGDMTRYNVLTGSFETR